MVHRPDPPRRLAPLLVLLLAGPALSGCTDEDGEKDTAVAMTFLVGNSSYCVGSAPPGASCETGDPAKAFDIEITGAPPQIVRLLHEGGSTAVNDSELAIDTGGFRVLADFRTNPRGPPDRSYEIGLGADVRGVGGLLALSLIFVQDGNFVQGEKEIDGPVRASIQGGKVVIEARPEAGPGRKATLTFATGDGMWPPERMTYTDANLTASSSSTYYRATTSTRLREALAAEPRNRIRPTLTYAWQSGRTALEDVPDPTGLGVSRSFATVIADAETLSQEFVTWTTAHPAWRLAIGTWYNLTDELWYIALRDGCERVDAAIRYTAEDKQIEGVETTSDCEDLLLRPEDGPVALSDPLLLRTLADLAVGDDKTLQIIEYLAPTTERTGTPMPDGARTSERPAWALTYRTTQTLSGFPWFVHHRLTAARPDSVVALQQILTIAPAPK